MKFNNLLIRYNRDKIHRLLNKDNKDYFNNLKYLQYNIPFSELKKLMKDGPYSKKIREYHPSSNSYSKPFYGDKLFYRFVDQFDKVLEWGYCFFFYGANGSGKTMTATYLLSKLVENDYNGYYIKFRDYIKSYNNVYYNFDDDKQEKNFYNYLMNCDLLIIDEVGKESSTSENVIGAFEDLIKYRSSVDKPCILIGNISLPKEFKNKYGNSVYNALLERYRFLHFSKKGNFRLKDRKVFK